MKIREFNPFRGIIETDYSPHARTLRTGFVQKMLDTFCVFAGSLEGAAGTPTKKHVGLLDFLFGPWSLFAYPLHRKFWKWLNGAGINGQGFAKFGKGLLLFFGILLNLPKYIIAAVLTLSIFLVVGAVQVIVRIVNSCNNREGNVYNLAVAGNTRANDEDHPEDGLLRDLLRDNKDLNTLTLTNIQPIPSDDDHPEETVQFTFSQDLVSDRVQRDPATYTVVFGVPAVTNKAALDAMLDLNVGGITKQLEQQKKNHHTTEKVLMTALGYH